MESLGLMPSSDGMVGGRTTGAKMAHYILDGGPFGRAFDELAASGWKLHLESTPYRGEARAPDSKVKFTCPGCGRNVWCKPDTEVFCKPCRLTSGSKLIELRAVDAVLDARSASVKGLHLGPCLGIGSSKRDRRPPRSPRAVNVVAPDLAVAVDPADDNPRRLHYPSVRTRYDGEAQQHGG
jgi:hypothetical protein